MCFGGSSEQQANTTNTSTTQTGIGGSPIIGGNVGAGTVIGFTGAQGLQLTKILTNAGANVTAQGFEFASQSQGRIFDSIDRAIAQEYSGLSSIIDATRDFSQRAIAASTNQQTPIVNLPAAGSSPAIVPAAGSDGSSLPPATLIALAGLAIGVIALSK